MRKTFRGGGRGEEKSGNLEIKMEEGEEKIWERGEKMEERNCTHLLFNDVTLTAGGK